MDPDSRELGEKLADSELSGLLRRRTRGFFCVAISPGAECFALQPPLGARVVRASPADRLKVTLWIMIMAVKPFSVCGLGIRRSEVDHRLHVESRRTGPAFQLINTSVAGKLSATTPKRL